MYLAKKTTLDSDKMRWVHIMKQGEYYEKGLTALFHRIFSAYDSSTTPPPLMLDIGMNIGMNIG